MTRKVFINRNVEAVFGYLASAATEPLWREGVLRTSAHEPGALRLGSKGTSRIRFIGREVDVAWEILDLVGESLLCREYASGVRGGRDRYILQQFGIGATVVDVEVEVEVAGLIGLLATGRRSLMERELRADLQRLKSILESN